MKPLYLLVFLFIFSSSFSEYCPDCGKITRRSAPQCLSCGKKISKLRAWFEGQKRFIPGLHQPQKMYFCPYCKKIHKKEHFYCFHCGKALLQRVAQTAPVRNQKSTARGSESLHSLLERSRKNPGSLTEAEKSSLVQWIRHRPISALFSQDQQGGGSSSPLPLPTAPKGPNPPNILIHQLKNMLSE